MVIRRLELFITNLSSDYENVYDDYNTISEYRSFIRSAFASSRIEIELQSVKSCVDINGSFNITIAGYSSMDLHDYNYMFIDMTSGETPEYKFAFITSVSSQNDGYYTKSVTLSCKLDAWAEHYLSIKANANSNIFTEKRCTVNGLLPNLANIYDKTFKPASYKTQSAHYMSENLQQRLSTSKYSNLRFLWMRILVDPTKPFNDFTTQTPYNGWSSASDTKMIINGVYANEGAYIILPVAAFDGNKPISYSETYRIGITDVTSNPPRWIWQEIPVNKLPIFPTEIYGNYVFDAEYTFFPPFQYIVDEYIADGISHFKIYPRFENSSLHLIEYRSTGSGDISNVIYGYANMGDRWAVSSTKRIIYTLSRYKTQFTYPTNHYDYIANMYDIDEFMHRYPFLRTVVCWNGKTIEINNTGTDEAKLILDLNGSLHPSFWVSTDSEQQFDIRNATTNTGTKYQMCTALDDYLTKNRNGLQHEMNGLMLSGINNTLSAVGGLFSAKSAIAPEISIAKVGLTAMKAVHDMETPMVRMLDLENYPANIQIPNISANDDIYAQDDIVILHQSGLSWNTPEIEEHEYMNHLYGHNITLNLSIVSKRREVFDVDSLQHCKLIGVQNLSDNNELSQAFLRGVRRWHISGWNNSESLLAILKNFDTGVYNLPVEV